MECEDYKTCMLKTDVPEAYENYFCRGGNDAICWHKLALIQIKCLEKQLKAKTEFISTLIKQLPEPIRPLP